jgi:hypothetical protein
MTLVLTVVMLAVIAVAELIVSLLTSPSAEEEEPGEYCGKPSKLIFRKYVRVI